MNLAVNNMRIIFLQQDRFPACNAARRLLKAKGKTAEVPYPSGEEINSPACSSIDQKRQSPKAGDFLLRLIGGSRRAISCGMAACEPQDTGIDKIEEMTALGNFG
jgi:hypothetical protein